MKYKFKAPEERNVFNWDLDGTLAKDNRLSKKVNKNVETLKKQYFSGNVIIIWTARLWNQAPKVVAFLEKYQIPYHGLKMNKGGADRYYDDKAIKVTNCE